MLLIQTVNKTLVMLIIDPYYRIGGINGEMGIRSVKIPCALLTSAIPTPDIFLHL